MKKLIPFLIVSFLWGLFSGRNEQIPTAYAIGLMVGVVFIPWGIANLQSHSVERKHKIFLWGWAILMFCQVFAHFSESL